MSAETFKVIEVTGTSERGQDDAIQSAIASASNTLNNLAWFEVVNSRGAIDGGTVKQFQVTLKVGFKLNES
jgi:flavin-binding protein dodecin